LRLFQNTFSHEKKKKGEIMKFKFVFVTTVLAASINVWAGAESSGGGYTVVCRDASGTIVSVELLDLFEGRTNFGFIYPAATGNIETDYVRAIKNGYRLQGYAPLESDEEYARNINGIFRNARLVDEYLVPANDLGKVPNVPTGCAIEPVARYYDKQNFVEINREIYNAMNSLNRAALIAHEVDYYWFRRFNAITSETARLTVAHVFSKVSTGAKEGIPPAVPEMVTWEPNPNPLHIGSADEAYTRYYVYRTPGQPFCNIQFATIAGHYVVAPTTVSVPQLIVSGQSYALTSTQFNGWTVKIENQLKRRTFLFSFSDRNHFIGKAKIDASACWN
jgi:hypothetical protein